MRDQRIIQTLAARLIRVRGTVQGVGFRPFVYRLAQENGLAGWVLNGDQGVEIFVEGPENSLDAFVRQLELKPPAAAAITTLELSDADPQGLDNFAIRPTLHNEQPTTGISPDLPVCAACLAELFDPQNKRYAYPYINCTNCGPRYTVILGLPYDRPNTTMKHWPLDAYCEAEYHDPANRRFHAQPVACPSCGPRFLLRMGEQTVDGSDASIRAATELLRLGKIVAVKGLGGYHLACDARNETAVAAMRERKYRKEKPFAVMARNLDVARCLIELSSEAEAVLSSVERPILLAPAKIQLAGVAPDNDELGVMLPYAPLHYLLFAAGAPEVLVMTSANRSNEPIAFEDQDAIARLSGIADAFLTGERPIARRVDDSVTRVSSAGTVVLRRARGYAPRSVTKLPATQPILALGADLKNSVTLVVEGHALVSQHIGDLDHYESLLAFQQTVSDLIRMYEICWQGVCLVHDAHPGYVSTREAANFPAAQAGAVQHHRAHIASALAERQEWEKQVIGVSFDGTGYGDDGAIWGGEFFVGSVVRGFERAAHLREAVLAGGDAAAQYPVQAAAGFLSQLDTLPEMTGAPFNFPRRYLHATELIRRYVRTFATTSIGRLFDTVAALLGFHREVSFEGQAAMWLEHLARHANAVAYPFPFEGKELDFRPLLQKLIEDRKRGRNIGEIALAFHSALACGTCNAVSELCDAYSADTVVLSGGVFQNELLLAELSSLLQRKRLQVWINHAVPPNDGGISLGQAAMAAFDQFTSVQASPGIVERSN